MEATMRVELDADGDVDVLIDDGECGGDGGEEVEGIAVVLSYRRCRADERHE